MTHTDISQSNSNILGIGTQIILRIDEYHDSGKSPISGTISAIVETDIYSVDGTRVLVKAGTKATIEYYTESNNRWGMPGSIRLTHATTQTIDNKRISLRLNYHREGKSKLATVIILSVVFFPWGLFSGFKKGKMPQIYEGTTISAFVEQNIIVG